MAACSFCGEGRDEVWALIAGPGVMVCDACVSTLRDVVAAGDGDGAPSSDVYGPCQFCGAEAPEARLIVGNEPQDGKVPVICTECVDLCGEALGGQIDLDGPWYAPLRFDGGHGIGAAGDDPDGVDVLLARARARASEIEAWAEQRLADLRAMDLPAGPDVVPIVRRKAIAVLIGDLGVERQLRVPYDVAVALAEALAGP